MIGKEKRREAAIQKELLLLQKQEEKLAAAAAKASGGSWKESLERKLPEKVYEGLQSAFCKGLRWFLTKGAP